MNIASLSDVLSASHKQLIFELVGQTKYYVGK